MSGSGKITTVAPPGPLTVNQHPRDVDCFTILDVELDMLSENFSSLSLVFAGASLGAAISLGATVLSVDTLDPKVHGGFVGTTVAMAVLTVFFGYNAVRDWLKARSTANTVRQRPVA